MKKSSLFLFGLAFTLMLVLSVTYNKKIANRVVAASSSLIMNQLPIYCVQTDKPQIALTFDAAWGDGNLR